MEEIKENLGVKTQKVSTITDEEKEKAISEYVTGAVEDNVIAFNAYKYKRLYPLAYQKCKEFMAKRARFEPGEDTILGVFMYTPRTIFYEFLDSEKLFINITGSDDEWRYEYNDEAFGGYKSRVYAEIAGFEEGFNRLNKQLTTT